MTEADLRALEPWFASRRIEPLRPPPDCGDGSVEEELAAADEVVVDSDLGAVLGSRRWSSAPAAKRLRVSCRSFELECLCSSVLLDCFCQRFESVVERALFVCEGAALGCRLFSSTSELSV